MVMERIEVVSNDLVITLPVVSADSAFLAMPSPFHVRTDKIVQLDEYWVTMDRRHSGDFHGTG